MSLTCFPVLLCSTLLCSVLSGPVKVGMWFQFHTYIHTSSLLPPIQPWQICEFFFFIVKTSIDLKVCSCVLYATLSQSTFVCLIFHKLLPVLVWNHFYSAIQVLTFKGISSISFSRCWWMPDRNLYLDNSLYHSAKITLLESTLSRVATALLYLTLTWNC